MVAAVNGVMTVITGPCKQLHVWGRALEPLFSEEPAPDMMVGADMTVCAEVGRSLRQQF